MCGTDSTRSSRLKLHWRKSVLVSGKGFLTAGLHKLLTYRFLRRGKQISEKKLMGTIAIGMGQRMSKTALCALSKLVFCKCPIKEP